MEMWAWHDGGSALRFKTQIKRVGIVAVLLALGCLILLRFCTV